MQRFALVGAGEVHDSGGAAADGGLGAGVKVVDGGGVAHVQIEVGMGVDEAGQQQLAGDVHGARQRVGEVAAYPQDLFVFHQNVRPTGAPTGDHGAVFE